MTRGFPDSIYMRRFLNIDLYEKYSYLDENKVNKPLTESTSDDVKIVALNEQGESVYVSSNNLGKVTSVSGKEGDVILKTSDLENDSDYTTNNKLNKEIQDRISADNLKLDKPTTNNTNQFVILGDGSTAPKSDFGKVDKVNNLTPDVNKNINIGLKEVLSIDNEDLSQSINVSTLKTTSNLEEDVYKNRPTSLTLGYSITGSTTIDDVKYTTDGSIIDFSDNRTGRSLMLVSDTLKYQNVTLILPTEKSGVLALTSDIKIKTINNQEPDAQGNIDLEKNEFVKNGVGWSLKYRADNPTFYGVIGTEAVDFSVSKSVNTVMPERFSYGANGFNSAVFGIYNSAMDAGSLVSGVQNRSQGQCNNIMSSNSTIIQDKGTGNFTKKDNGIYSGSNNTIENNRNSTVIGGGNNRMVGKISPVNNMYDMYNAIIGGNNNTLTNSISNIILGGTLNNIIGEEKSGENGSYNSNNAIIGGYKNKIITATSTNRQAYSSVIFGGEENIAQGYYNMVAGYGNHAVTAGEVLTGIYGTVQNTSLSGHGFISDSRMFNVGIGLSQTNGTIIRRDGLSVYRNGLVLTPTTNNALIEGNVKSVITKEYLDIRIPKPPTTGEYTLKSINGVVSWVLN